MVRLVLFDVDGTLVHTGRAGVQSFAKVFATEFNVANGIERLKFGGRTDYSLVREFFGYNHIPATPENFRRFFDLHVFWLDHILEQSRGEICPGAREFIRDLKSVPSPPLLGLLTGNIRLGAEIKLRHFNLWDEFVCGAFSDDHEDRAQIAAIACQRGCRILKEDLRGDQVVVIGDTPLDIACARAVGAKALAVATGGATLEALDLAKPDWAVRDLRQISAAGVCM